METLAQENVVLSQNQPILPEQPKQNSFLTILLSVLLLLSVSIAGFFAYQTQILVKELNSMKATSTPVSIEDSRVDSTADWKTYTNEKQNVTFKYPQAWKLVEKEKGEDVEGRIYNSSIQLANGDSKIEVVFDLIGIGGGPRNVPYDEIELWGKKYYMQYGNMNFEKNTKTINISDSPTGLGAFQINSKTYMVSLTYEVQNEGEKPKAQLVKEFNQILSTFKFVESGMTSDWKTYINEKFTFKYPIDVVISSKTQGKEEIFEIKGLDKDIVLVVDPIEEHNFYLGKKVSKQIKYNNVSWNLLTGNEQYCDGGECSKISDALQVEYQNKRYTIVLGDLSYSNLEFDQILSTFKFVD